MIPDPPLPVMSQRISQEIERQKSDFRGRVIQWSIQAVIATGVPRDTVLALLEGKTPDRHWWHVRQLLPEEGIRSLYFKVVKEFGELPSTHVPGTSRTTLTTTAVRIHAPHQNSPLPGAENAEFEEDEWEEVA